MDVDKFLEKLNNECYAQDGEKWTRRDIEVCGLDFQRDYCYSPRYCRYELCGNCRANLKTHPDYVRNKLAIMEEFIQKLVLKEFGKEATEALQSNIDEHNDSDTDE